MHQQQQQAAPGQFTGTQPSHQQQHQQHQQHQRSSFPQLRPLQQPPPPPPPQPPHPLLQQQLEYLSPTELETPNVHVGAARGLQQLGSGHSSGNLGSALSSGSSIASILSPVGSSTAARPPLMAGSASAVIGLHPQQQPSSLADAPLPSPQPTALCDPPTSLALQARTVSASSPWQAQVQQGVASAAAASGAASALVCAPSTSTLGGTAGRGLPASGLLHDAGSFFSAASAGMPAQGHGLAGPAHAVLGTSLAGFTPAATSSAMLGATGALGPAPTLTSLGGPGLPAESEPLPASQAEQAMQWQQLLAEAAQAGYDPFLLKLPSL